MELRVRVISLTTVTDRAVAALLRGVEDGLTGTGRPVFGQPRPVRSGRSGPLIDVLDEWGGGEEG